jgi:ribonucleoside-diphosphate reductase beta chain
MLDSSTDNSAALRAITTVAANSIKYQGNEFYSNALKDEIQGGFLLMTLPSMSHSEFTPDSVLLIDCYKDEQSRIESKKEVQNLRDALIERYQVLDFSIIELTGGELCKKMPKPEIAAVGFTFAESEVRHMDAYSHLLEILGLNEEFARIKEMPVLMERVEYLEYSISTAKSEDNKEYALAILLFSLFIEHVSLFSQFLIMMSFNKHKNLFKGISNAVEATSKEEQIHGMFGIEVINLIKAEHPEWFDGSFKEKIVQACRVAFDSEKKVLDWILEAGELEFLPKAVIIEFIKNRLNNSLDSIGLERIFPVDEKLLEETEWFDEEIVTTKHGDFFVKRSINYNKRSQSITGDDLF